MRPPLGAAPSSRALGRAGTGAPAAVPPPAPVPPQPRRSASQSSRSGGVAREGGASASAAANPGRAAASAPAPLKRLGSMRAPKGPSPAPAPSLARAPSGKGPGALAPVRVSREPSGRLDVPQALQDVRRQLTERLNVTQPNYQPIALTEFGPGGDDVSSDGDGSYSGGGGGAKGPASPVRVAGVMAWPGCVRTASSAGRSSCRAASFRSSASPGCPRPCPTAPARRGRGGACVLTGCFWRLCLCQT